MIPLLELSPYARDSMPESESAFWTLLSRSYSTCFETDIGKETGELVDEISLF